MVSMIEISHSGKQPRKIKNGKTRTFLEDGDTITIRAYCEKDGKRVGFGECVGTILP
jgi:fumarylacetoacetase